MLPESKEGSRRVCESEEKAGSLASAVRSWGSRPGGGVRLVPAVWPQGWEETAITAAEAGPSLAAGGWRPTQEAQREQAALSQAPDSRIHRDRLIPVA